MCHLLYEVITAWCVLCTSLSAMCHLLCGDYHVVCVVCCVPVSVMCHLLCGDYHMVCVVYQ